ncbi:hypothetical protein NMY22_g19526 [Coprinellus aureogranulatus]|nr:hypothetical protein NMY22_g19526 [Coprinellus aureogranulatus]
MPILVKSKARIEEEKENEEQERQVRREQAAINERPSDNSRGRRDVTDDEFTQSGGRVGDNAAVERGRGWGRDSRELQDRRSFVPTGPNWESNPYMSEDEEGIDFVLIRHQARVNLRREKVVART